MAKKRLSKFLDFYGFSHKQFFGVFVFALLLAAIPLTKLAADVGFDFPFAREISSWRPRRPSAPSACALGTAGAYYKWAGSYTTAETTVLSGYTLMTDSNSVQYVSADSRLFKMRPSPLPSTMPPAALTSLGWMGKCVAGVDCTVSGDTGHSKYITGQGIFTCDSVGSPTCDLPGASPVLTYYDVQFAGIGSGVKDAAGNLYIPDKSASSSRITKLDANGNFVGWMGRCNGGGSGGNNCSVPTGGNIATDGYAHGFVCTNDTCARPTASAGGNGTGTYQFTEPKALAINNSTNELFIADSGNDKIKVFNLTTKAMRNWGVNNGSTIEIRSIVYNPVNGLVYVGAQHGDTKWYLWITNTNGVVQTSGYPNGYPMNDRIIAQMDVSADGYVYIAGGDHYGPPYYDPALLFIFSPISPYTNRIIPLLKFGTPEQEFNYRLPGAVRVSGNGDEVYITTKKCNNSSCSSVDPVTGVHKFVCNVLSSPAPSPTPSSIPNPTPSPTPSPLPSPSPSPSPTPSPACTPPPWQTPPTYRPGATVETDGNCLVNGIPSTYLCKNGPCDYASGTHWGKCLTEPRVFGTLFVNGTAVACNSTDANTIGVSKTNNSPILLKTACDSSNRATYQFTDVTTRNTFKTSNYQLYWYTPKYNGYSVSWRCQARKRGSTTQYSYLCPQICGTGNTAQLAIPTTTTVPADADVRIDFYLNN